MDFSTLPKWPQVFRGETKQSWMMAAASEQPIDEADWLELVKPSHREPERPADGARWDGLPSGLGEIRSVEPAWRLAPGRRRVFCPQCTVGTGDGQRWPTHVRWLDVRRLQCGQHGCPLVYRNPMLGVDPGHAGFQTKPEALSLYEWTRSWILLDYSVLPEARLEGLWRRDLVHMVCRNWTPARSHSAAGLGAWELYLMGWYAQEQSGPLSAGCPGRLGELSAPERLGSLLLAYRAWRCFRKEPAPIPSLPRIAWMWLGRRWDGRFPCERRESFEEIVINLITHA